MFNIIEFCGWNNLVLFNKFSVWLLKQGISSSKEWRFLLIQCQLSYYERSGVFLAFYNGIHCCIIYIFPVAWCRTYLCATIYSHSYLWWNVHWGLWLILKLGVFFLLSFKTFVCNFYTNICWGLYCVNNFSHYVIWHYSHHSVFHEAEFGI